MKYFSESRSRLDQGDTGLDLTLSPVAPNLPDDKPSPGNIKLKIIAMCNIFHQHHSVQSIVSMKRTFPKLSTCRYFCVLESSLEVLNLQRTRLQETGKSKFTWDRHQLFTYNQMCRDIVDQERGVFYLRDLLLYVSQLLKGILLSPIRQQRKQTESEM